MRLKEYKWIFNLGYIMVGLFGFYSLWYGYMFLNSAKKYLPTKETYGIVFLSLALISVLFIISIALNKIKGKFDIWKRTLKSYGLTLNMSKMHTVPLYVLMLGPIALLGRLMDPYFDIWYTEHMGLFTWGAVGWFILIMPLYVLHEEIMIRSIVQSRFSRVLPPLVVVLAVSLLFSLYHWYPNIHGIFAVIFVFLGSLVLTVQFWHTNSLLQTFIVHLINNLLAVLQIYLHYLGHTKGEPYIMLEVLFWVVYMGLLIYFRKHVWRILKSVGRETHKELGLIKKS
ncbi:CPBP family intramembrane metalloprotease [Candidatus Woesearchaeota archaeon]|nr:CPBP family intramembrane metalloprotease [Candidatus Woesearchaeota archaeon]